MAGDRLLAYRDCATVDRRLADTKIRPVMADARARHHLECGGSAAHDRMIAEEGPGMAEEAARRLGHQPERCEDVIMCLIGLVQHDRHSVRCSGTTPMPVPLFVVLAAPMPRPLQSFG
jgi:hypothetical protein